MNQATRQAQFTEYAAAKLPWLRRVAYLLCQDWHLADDLVQTSVTKLYLNWHRVDSAANPDGYARAILVNTFIQERRSPWWKRVVLQRDRDGVDTAGPDEALARIPAPAAPDPDGAMDLRRVLPLLPAKQRATLVLRYYCELSVIETAELLGCSTGTVKSQTSRALDTLRRLMGVDAEAPPGDRANAAVSHIETLASSKTATEPARARPRTAAHNHVHR